MTTRSISGKGNKHTGDVSVQLHETDSPIIPVEAIERLQATRPDAVDFIITETKIEGDHRRKQHQRTNTFIFIERIVGQVFAFGTGLAAIGGGVYLGRIGFPKEGTVLASIAIGGLAVVFITGRNPKK